MPKMDSCFRRNDRLFTRTGSENLNIECKTICEIVLHAEKSVTCFSAFMKDAL
ncbi:Uncharacterized protein dnm_047930 [Desulfonema magnum]|uniref:Uncharacterized protein n=1 Tax=Desulfonema magnum TaxID=45655 RepID=A0A975BNJ2_9BACT|nr:Uncharacterized protein dnm_047930 [Desulfonema magnum]